MEEGDIDLFINRRLSPDSIAEWYVDKVRFPGSEKNVRENTKDWLEDCSKDDKRIFVVDAKDPSGETGPRWAGVLDVWSADRRSGVFRYGVNFEEEYRGKGLAQEALILVLDYYFNELNYQKASPFVYSYNPHSQAFHRKFGFRKEAVIPREVYSRGEYFDIVYFGMFKEEFNRLYSDRLWKPKKAP
jgi:RimJ/RimL family protein N-acetyltransferase